MNNARWLALALAAGAVVVIAALTARPAAAAVRPGAPIRHVVVVGISGLRWSQVTPAADPGLWRLAGQGSVGGLVDYAESPVACPADGWLTLNSGARAAAPRRAGGQCAALPPVVRDGSGARVPALPGLIAYNARFDQNPRWGALGRQPAGVATGCATAAGPGAALALAGPDGAVRDYVPSPDQMSARLLARCPLTVVDLGQLPYAERVVPAATARTLSRIVAGLPAGTLLLVTAPGGVSGASDPHLLTTIVSGPGYEHGMLAAASTRQPGIVTLTDLTPSVAHWLGRAAHGDLVGSVITRGDRGSLPGAVATLTGTDTAEQVWISTHAWFFVGYAALDIALLGVPALFCRLRRAACWRVTGTVAAAVPAATFLAGLTPWAGEPDPSVWLYGVSAGWTAVLAGLAFGGRWRRDPLGPAGVICLVTLVVLGTDVMTGSRLQRETPFGLSLLEAGRYYGLGNMAIGVYCAAALVTAVWLAETFPRRRLVLVALVALFSVTASGWPGFGAKVGGTIALVPCFALLALELAGKRPRWRHAVPLAVSGLVLVTVFALASYLLPALGVSDMGAFFGTLLHGQGGALLERKASSNLGSLTLSALSPLVPAGVVVTGLALFLPPSWRPGWFGPLPLASRPLLRVTVSLIWLALVIGWLADDSGVVVPAAAAPFAVPLVIAMAESARVSRPGPVIVNTAFDGSSVAGQQATLHLE